MTWMNSWFYPFPSQDHSKTATTFQPPGHGGGTTQTGSHRRHLSLPESPTNCDPHQTQPWSKNPEGLSTRPFDGNSRNGRRQGVQHGDCRGFLWQCEICWKNGAWRERGSSGEWRYLTAWYDGWYREGGTEGEEFARWMGWDESL